MGVYTYFGNIFITYNIKQQYNRHVRNKENRGLLTIQLIAYKSCQVKKTLSVRSKKCIPKIQETCDRFNLLIPTDKEVPPFGSFIKQYNEAPT